MYILVIGGFISVMGTSNLSLYKLLKITYIIGLLVRNIFYP